PARGCGRRPRGRRAVPGARARRLRPPRPRLRRAARQGVGGAASPGRPRLRPRPRQLRRLPPPIEWLGPDLARVLPRAPARAAAPAGGRRGARLLAHAPGVRAAVPGARRSLPPARLHGDLWGGNLLCDDRGAPCLIDPAVYGGHREIDLAMMRLFGGFGARVFEAYEETAPLAEGHAARVTLYQLYPL